MCEKENHVVMVKRKKNMLLTKQKGKIKMSKHTKENHQNKNGCKEWNQRKRLFEK